MILFFLCEMAKPFEIRNDSKFFLEFLVDIHIIKLQQSMRNLLNLRCFRDLSVPNGIIKIQRILR